MVAKLGYIKYKRRVFTPSTIKDQIQTAFALNVNLKFITTGDGTKGGTEIFEEALGWIHVARGSTVKYPLTRQMYNMKSKGRGIGSEGGIQSFNMNISRSDGGG